MVDIDGVVVKGRTIIGKAKDILQSILTPIDNSMGTHIPFALLTNGGGIPEHEKATEMNRRLGIAEDDLRRLTKEHMILCHTPLRDPDIIAMYKDKFVVVTGKYDELRVAQSYGYSKVVHVEELAIVFPDIAPNDMDV